MFELHTLHIKDDKCYVTGCSVNKIVCCPFWICKIACFYYFGGQGISLHWHQKACSVFDQGPWRYSTWQKENNINIYELVIVFVLRKNAILPHFLNVKKYDNYHGEHDILIKWSNTMVKIDTRLYVQELRKSKRVYWETVCVDYNSTK